MALADLYEDEWGFEQTTPADNGYCSTVLQQQWFLNGFVVIPNLIPDAPIDEYMAEWRQHSPGPGGWPYPTPYRTHPRLRELCCYGPLHDVLQELTGEPMGVHLNLTGWVSTERDWHADQYLNEPHVGGYYAAAWIALDDVDPLSGPFQFVAGSHKWPPLSQAKIRAALGVKGNGPEWPKHSEQILTDLYEKKLADEGCEISTHVPKRGTVLIWHSRLLHRGSKPRQPLLSRRALIAHYSGIGHRPDMPRAVPCGDGWQFPL